MDDDNVVRMTMMTKMPMRMTMTLKTPMPMTLDDVCRPWCCLHSREAVRRPSASQAEKRRFFRPGPGPVSPRHRST